MHHFRFVFGRTPPINVFRAMLAHTGVLLQISARCVRRPLESWYTSRRSFKRLPRAVRKPLTQPTSYFLEGREPAVTRIPLNRAYEQSQDIKDKLEMSTAEIGLAVRTTNCLEERGVFTVNDLLHCTREDLLSISNFGEKTLEEVYKALESVGFYRPDRERTRV
jgi:DNA-directed RNA polymerase subunit alpha